VTGLSEVIHIGQVKQEETVCTLSGYVRTSRRSQAEVVYVFTREVAHIFGTLTSE
jgi:hypothetical protein